MPPRHHRGHGEREEHHRDEALTPARAGRDQGWSILTVQQVSMPEGPLRARPREPVVQCRVHAHQPQHYGGTEQQVMQAAAGVVIQLPGHGPVRGGGYLMYRRSSPAFSERTVA